jgi:outer membrane protein TolC
VHARPRVSACRRRPLADRLGLGRAGLALALITGLAAGPTATATLARAAPPTGSVDEAEASEAAGPSEGPQTRSSEPPLADPPRLVSEPLKLRSQSGTQERLLGHEDPIRGLFELPPSARDDSYGPRPAGVPALSREQIVRYALDNPYVRAADQHIEAMEALLRTARFAWVPIIKTSAVLTPGAAIECDDVTLQGENGPFSYQYCRAAGEPANGAGRPADLQTITGYFDRIAQAGVAFRLSADFVAPITTFGKIVNYKRLAKVGVELAELQKLATQHETVLKVYEAHAALLLARESIGILQEAWRVLGQERGKIQSDLGLGADGEPEFDADPDSLNVDRDPADLIRLELGEIELASRMRQARLIESQALATLWAFAGNAAPHGFDVAERQLIADDVFDGLDTLDHYRSLALQNRPEARLADAGVKARKVQEKIARTNFLPDLGAVVRLGYGYANAATPEMRTLYYTGRLNYSNIYFGLALSWDLDFHNDAFALQRARAEKREAEYKREAAQALLLLEVEQAYRAVLDAEQQLRFAELARDKAWRLVVSEQTSASIGVTDFLELGRALEQWAEFEFQRFEAVMKRNTAIAKLSRTVGMRLSSPPQPT